jgi:hypothetical protein
MGSLSSIHEGTISARPFEAAHSGRISGSCERGETGMLHGSNRISGGTLSADSSESPASAATAEIGNLIASLGSLSSQAQSLPLSPPTLPGLPQNQSYHPQPVDYAFGDDSN